MSNKIFMSYSRREFGFVDDLVSDLEDKKYNVWLDYRVLIYLCNRRDIFRWFPSSSKRLVNE